MPWADQLAVAVGLGRRRRLRVVEQASIFTRADRLEPLGHLVRPRLESLPAPIETHRIGLVEALESGERHSVGYADLLAQPKRLLEQGLVLRVARYLGHAAKPLAHVDGIPGRAVKIMLVVMLDATSHLGVASGGHPLPHQMLVVGRRRERISLRVREADAQALGRRVTIVARCTRSRVHDTAQKYRARIPCGAARNARRRPPRRAGLAAFIGAGRRRRPARTTSSASTRSKAIRRILEIATIDALSLENSIVRSRTLISAAMAATKLLDTGELEGQIATLEAAVGVGREHESDEIFPDEAM